MHVQLWAWALLVIAAKGWGYVTVGCVTLEKGVGKTQHYIRLQVPCGSVATATLTINTAKWQTNLTKDFGRPLAVACTYCVFFCMYA